MTPPPTIPGKGERSMPETTNLAELIERLERAEGPSDELSALIICALLAPKGSYVRESQFNGAWCIYTDGPGRSDTPAGPPRLWEDRNHRPGGWPVTASMDAALALVGRALPEFGWMVTQTTAEIYKPDNPMWEIGAIAASPALALCLALLKALHALGDQP